MSASAAAAAVRRPVIYKITSNEQLGPRSTKKIIRVGDAFVRYRGRTSGEKQKTLRVTKISPTGLVTLSGITSDDVFSYSAKQRGSTDYKRRIYTKFGIPFWGEPKNGIIRKFRGIKEFYNKSKNEYNQLIEEAAANMVGGKYKFLTSNVRDAAAGIGPRVMSETTVVDSTPGGFVVLSPPARGHSRLKVHFRNSREGPVVFAYKAKSGQEEDSILKRSSPMIKAARA